MTQVSSLYLHVPFCKHLCNYCDFYKRKLENPTVQFEEFHRTLEAELKRHADLMETENVAWSPLETVYLGGGTPSLWGKDGADFFNDKILSQIKLKSGAEFTMEVDPGTWNEELILAWKKIGLNRISIGTQTLNLEFLKIMDRIHSKDESLNLLKYCQQNDWNFSLDFLLGIPFSKVKNRDIINELEELLTFKPKHISLYILNARNKYPHAQDLPDDDYIRDEYLKMSEFLISRGFHHYEVSNFALPGFESKHNLKYWRSESVAALGPTGTGLFRKNETTAVRYKWKVSQAEFEPENLGSAELELERTYLELRTSRGWKPKSTPDSLIELFTLWNSQGYGRWDQDRMRLNSLGFVMLDSLMDDLFKWENTL